MHKLTSIMVIVNRTDGDQLLVDKAVVLARQVGAQILLYSCDAELARIIQHAYKSEDAERSWHISQSDHLAYLQRLREAARAKDVQISVAAECWSPPHEAIINKARDIEADLVMKTPAGVHPLRRFTFGPSDWHLMRDCPATLMLVGPKPWTSPPSFAALVSVAEEETERLAETIVHSSEYFALGCHGELDIVYSEASPDEAERERRAAALQRLIQEYHIPAAHVHVLSGDPDLTVPDFAARHHYDAVALGGVSHRKAYTPLGGTLTSRLVEALDSDFILVKPEPPPRLEKANVAWQALFGD